MRRFSQSALSQSAVIVEHGTSIGKSDVLATPRNRERYLMRTDVSPGSTLPMSKRTTASGRLAFAL